MLDLLVLGFFPGLMIFTAFSDIATMRIPNFASLLLILGFFLIAFCSGMPLAQIGSHATAGLLALAICLLLFLGNVLGGGDAKIIASTVLWLGYDELGFYLLSAALIGGVLAMGMIYFRQMPLADAVMRKEWIARLHTVTVGMPYGVALAFGGLCAYPFSPVWRQVILAAV